MPVAAGQETGELGELRTQLLRFLNKSTHYRAEKLIRTFPYECEYGIYCLVMFSPQFTVHSKYIHWLLFLPFSLVEVAYFKCR